MAIVFYTGQDEKYAIADQGTWGTGAATNAAGQGLHLLGWDFKPTVNVIQRNTAKAQRFAHTTDWNVNEKGVVHEIAMPATPFLKDQGDKFLYAVMQNVSEGTATPYEKTFTFGATQPDFSANGGNFYSLINKMPVAASGHEVVDCIMRELTLSCAPGANDGMLTAEGQWIGRSHSEAFNYSGTITYPDVDLADFFFFHDLSVKTIGGTAVVLGPDGIKLSISNGAVPVGGVSGLPQTYGLTGYSATLTIQALYDATLITQMANQRAGTAAAVILEWGTDNADGYLSITANVKWSAPRDITHAKEGEFVTLTGTVYGAASPAIVPLTIVHANAIDRAW